MVISEYIYYQQCQQIIRNYTVLDGAHYVTDKDFCEAMIAHYSELLAKVEDGTHISLMPDELQSVGIVDVDDLRHYLSKMYKTDITRYMSQLINLTFSEN